MGGAVAGHARPTHHPDDRQALFTDRLIRELDGLHRRYPDLRPRTVFVGGGTPTLLRPELWRSLLDALGRSHTLDAVREFTVEANPETVTDELMGVLAGGGVNRISIGAQSFEPRSLEALGRWHAPASVAGAVGVVRDAGIGNINLDLIFAVPGQTVAMLRADLETALALEPEHLSCYGLTYEPNTPMTRRMKSGRLTPVAESLERDMYAVVLDRLEAAGYEHYEVSNWARPGCRCRHNLMYWHNENWLGIGPAAASHVEGQRWRNQPNLSRYLGPSVDPPTMDHERLPDDQSVGEQLMLMLRLRQGVPLSWLHRHVPDGSPRVRVVEEMCRIGVLQQTATHLCLTRRGLFVADAVIGELL